MWTTGSKGYLGLPQQGTAHTQQLTLAHAEVVAVLSDPRKEPLCHAAHRLLRGQTLAASVLRCILPLVDIQMDILVALRGRTP